MTTENYNKVLRFGIMCNGYEFQHWQFKCIENILELNNVVPALLIINSGKNETWNKLSGKFKTIFSKHFFYKLYLKILFNSKERKIVNIKRILGGVEGIECTTSAKEKYSEYFSEEDVKKIKEHNLDFILRFGFNIIKGEILNSAKYGVWSFHHGDETKYRGGPAGFWEIYNNDSVNGVVLQKLTEKLDAGIILKKGYFKTIRHSYNANFDNILSSSIDFPKQVCIDIMNGVAGYFYATQSSTNAVVYKFPGNWQMFLFFIKQIKNIFRFHYDELFKADHWNIGIIKKPVCELLNENAFEVKWLPIKKDNEFRADGFAYLDNEKLNILFEKYNYKNKKGNISKIEVDENLKFTEDKIILEKPCHLSYPYIFEVDNEFYCIPESAENNQVDLYKIDKQENKINFQKTLLNNIPAIDSTVFRYNNYWWLFCTIKENASNENLFIFYSDSFDGNYTEHKNNPVKNDVKSARPAGTPFLYNDKLYRPSQDCSDSYGCRIKINEIIKLTTSEFEEKEVKTIEPFKNSKFNKGIHTIASVGDYTIIDSKQMIFIPSAFATQFKRKIKKIFL
ncbi:MAG: hypothetical protein PHD97_02745 [Bacteroidales bacterium]|nr:hypothetical protein [Bacteroidales bacterium]